MNTDNSEIEDKLIGDENNIVFYTDEEENVSVEVILQNENVWLNTQSIARLFHVQRADITKHINKIYKDEELEENSTCSKMEQVQKEGNRSVTRNISYYNLDMIISIGFRVNSKPAIKFRTWANKAINLDVAETEAKEQKTMTMNDWIEVADDLLKYRKKNILKDAGKVSHKQAVEKANKEYEKFRVKQDEEYISSMDKLLSKYLSENK